MKKILALALLLALCLTLLAACGGQSGGAKAEPATDSAYILGNKKMIIGYTVYEPMNYTDENGEFTGFDTELAKAVCQKLGVEPDFVVINWDTKEVALEAKDIDCIWNGLTLNPEREANMACTGPYVKNAQVVVVKKGFDYKGTESLIGGTVCAEIGSAGEEQIKGNYSDPDDPVEPEPNLAQADYVGKSMQTDCLMEVKAGTADAAVLDMTLANSMTGEGTNYADLVIVDYLAAENYGVAFRKGSDMRDKVDEIFKAMRADGSLQALADKYGLELAD
jgi:polar amino acid transport system substrate-binding protein